ncbi:hypothetical protein PFISCL1PPCAC_8177, partial [Pristionchus fissidentatus]
RILASMSTPRTVRGIGIIFVTMPHMRHSSADLAVSPADYAPTPGPLVSVVHLGAGRYPPLVDPGAGRYPPRADPSPTPTPATPPSARRISTQMLLFE